MSSNKNHLVAVRPYFSVNRRCPSIRIIRLIVLIQSAVWVRPDVRTPATGNTLMWVCHWDDNWKNLTPVHSKPSMWTAKIKKVWILRNWFHVKILTDGKMVKFSHCAGQTFVSLILHTTPYGKMWFLSLWKKCAICKNPIFSFHKSIFMI